MDRAAVIARLEERPCVTREMRLHGWAPAGDGQYRFEVYGSDAVQVEEVCRERPEWSEPLHERLPYVKGEVVYAVRHEMARTVDDVLSRRLRALLLDARAAIQVAPFTAETMAAELRRGENWVEAQIKQFTELARGYLLES